MSRGPRTVSRRDWKREADDVLALAREKPKDDEECSATHTRTTRRSSVTALRVARAERRVLLGAANAIRKLGAVP